MSEGIAKTRDEIQRAHDILHFLGSPEAPPLFDDLSACSAAHDALAWILGFPCGETFQENLDAARKAIRAAGFEEVDAGRALSPDEAKERGLR